MNQTIDQKIAGGHLTKIQNLAHRSLHYKWIPNQSQNLNMLLHFCPFCQDAMFFSKGKDLCESCLSPPLLCCEKGEGGFLGYLKSKYGYERMDSIEPEEYELMRTALSEIISTGSIAQKTEQTIRNKIRMYRKKVRN